MVNEKKKNYFSANVSWGLWNFKWTKATGWFRICSTDIPNRG